MNVNIFFRAIVAAAVILLGFGGPALAPPPPHAAPAAPAAHLTFPGGSVPARVVHTDGTGSYVLADHLTRAVPADKLAVSVGSHTYPSAGTDCGGPNYCLVHIWQNLAAVSTEETLPDAIASGLGTEHDAAVATLADIPGSAPDAAAVTALYVQQAKLNNQYETESSRNWTLADVKELAKSLPAPANTVPIRIATKSEARDAGDNAAGWVNSDEVAIYLPPASLKDAYASDLRGTLLHESMHIIQNTKNDGYRTLSSIAGDLTPKYKKELQDPNDPHLPMDEAVASCAEPAFNSDYRANDCTYAEELKVYDWISSTEGAATADQWWPYLVWAAEDTMRIPGYSHPIFPTPAMVRDHQAAH